MDKIRSTPSGAQAVDRALHVLSVLASAHEQGLHLSDVMAAVGLPRATTHRLLATLVSAGYAMRSGVKRYHLGVQAMQLGLVAMRRAPAIAIWSPAMKSIARISEDTVYLMVRNGDFAHAIHMEQGPRAMRKFPSDVGGFMLLGLGTGGRALLGTLSDHEIRTLWQRHPQSYALNGLSVARLLEIGARARSEPYVVTENAVTEGVVGIGVALSMGGQDFVAMSVAAEAYRMPLERRRSIGEMLRAATAGKPLVDLAAASQVSSQQTRA